jgi:hypothetical protein
MTTLITRSTTSGIGVTAKNNPLTNSELDNNFISLNDNKLEKNSSISVTTISAAGAVSSTTLYASGVITSLATIYDSKGDVRAAPLNTLSTSGYTTVAADAGKTVAVSGNTIIGTSVHGVGDMVTFYNSSAASIAILSTGLTVYLAGTATTGTRTLAQRGIATILCVSSNTFVISGAGLT